MDGGGRWRDDDGWWEAELQRQLAAAGEPDVPDDDPDRVYIRYGTVRSFQECWGIGTHHEGGYFYDVGECMVRRWRLE